MTCPSDQLLAAQVRQGDERAFVTLVRRYERVLARLIGQYIGTGDDGVQDVLQETMASAWSALRRDTPRDVRAWIMQVARNRCRDYFRSTQRRELFVEDQTLELMVNRRGLAQARQRQVTWVPYHARSDFLDKDLGAGFRSNTRVRFPLVGYPNRRDLLRGKKG